MRGLRNGRVNHGPIPDTPGPLSGGKEFREMDKALMAHPLEPGQLGQWIGMVINPQIEAGILLAGVNAQGRTLLAAFVAPRGFAGLQGQDQAPGKGLARMIPIRLGGARYDLGAGQHVAGHRKALMHGMPAPVDALGARVHGDATLGVLQMQLTALTPGIGLKQDLRNGLCRQTLPQQPQAPRAEGGIDERLRGQRAHTAIGMDTQGTDGKKTGGHRNAEGAGRRITSNEGPGHGVEDTTGAGSPAFRSSMPWGYPHPGSRSCLSVIPTITHPPRISKLDMREFSWCFLALSLATLLVLPAPAAAQDTSRCYSIRDNDRKNMCLALARRDASTCYSIRDNDDKNLCLAQVRGQRSTCYSIRDNDQKNQCLAMVR